MQERIVRIALLACALSAATAVSAQAPTEKQVRDNANTQERTDDGGHDVGHGQKQYFDSLDRGQKGYLSNDDVSADPFLSKNYPNCDADHDGKLTWPELRACTINNPPPAERP
ncbi:MAG TPA: hypothetical protein VFE67_05310 [Rudaea sp.]|jgi:hypothetical protein|nr:hypothetical protein [Rudaea sp.]